jgi:hypothetical protein
MDDDSRISHPVFCMQFTGHESNFPIRPLVFRQARKLINFWRCLVILLLYIASSVDRYLLPLRFVSTMSEIWSNFETHSSVYLYPVADCLPRQVSDIPFSKLLIVMYVCMRNRMFHLHEAAACVRHIYRNPLLT